MGIAYQCDLCLALEAGDPVVKFVARGLDPNATAKPQEDVYCYDCSASFSEWRQSRIQLREVEQ